MATATRLLTVAEFSALPEDAGPVYHELRHGEVVAVTRPRLKHFFVQRTLRRLLESLADRGSIVDTEFAFRPLPEYELRVADVAWIAAERLQNLDPESHFPGAPDLVIEVLSRSNTASDIYDKEKLCLENGCREFWVVDPDRRQVKISTPDGHTTTWRADQEIPLPLFANARLAVHAIFD
jgi:Uma2 family endonuclease